MAVYLSFTKRSLETLLKGCNTVKYNYDRNYKLLMIYSKELSKLATIHYQGLYFILIALGAALYFYGNGTTELFLIRAINWSKVPNIETVFLTQCINGIVGMVYFWFSHRWLTKTNNLCTRIILGVFGKRDFDTLIQISSDKHVLLWLNNAICAFYMFLMFDAWAYWINVKYIH